MVKSDYEQDQIMAFSRVMSRIISLEPEACMSLGFQVTELDDADQTALESTLTRLGFYCKMVDAHTSARKRGGACVYMQVFDGRDSDQPIDMNNIMSLQGLVVFDKSELFVDKWCDAIGSSNFGMPEIYRVTSMSSSFRVHYTRMLHFDGVKVDRQMRQRDFCRGFSPSVIDQVWDAFEIFGTTHSYLANAIPKHTQGVLKIKDLNRDLTSDNADKIRNRLAMLLQTMSTLGDAVVDSEGEDYQIATRSMTGYSEAADIARNLLVMTTGIPKSLIGINEGEGLSSGEHGGDWKCWYAQCRSTQGNYLEPLIRKFLSILFAARNSPVADPPLEFTIAWPPLETMSEKEKAEIYAMRSTARASDVAARIISPEEARRSPDVIEAYGLQSLPGAGEDPEDPYAEVLEEEPLESPEITIQGAPNLRVV